MNIIWGSCYTVMKWGFDYFSPMHLLFLRMSVGFLVMLVFSFRYLKFLDRRVLIRGACLGAIIAVSHGLSFIGIYKSFATDAGILYAIEPIAAIVVARIMLKEKMDKWCFLALVLALTGFSILSDISLNNFLSNKVFLGNLLILIGVLADGFYSPVAKPIAEKYPARLILTTGLFFTTVIIFPFALISPVKSFTITWQGMFSIFYLSILCTCCGWTLWLYFLGRFPVNVVALTVFIQPVVGAFVPHFTIGEQISPRIWFGGSIILIGVFIAVFKRKKTKEDLLSEGVLH